jgi:hypothetical protein
LISLGVVRHVAVIGMASNNKAHYDQAGDGHPWPAGGEETNDFLNLDHLSNCVVRTFQMP